MKPPRKTLLSVAAALLFAGPAHALDFSSLYSDPYDSRFYIAPMGSYVFNHHARGEDNGFGGQVAVGKPVLSFLEIEVIGQYLRFDAHHETTTSGGLLGIGATTTTTGQSESVGGGGVGINLSLAPYVTDLTRGFFLHADVVSGKHTYEDVGLGYDLPFGRFFDKSSFLYSLGLRAEALYHRDNGHDETQLNLGLRYALGSLPEPESLPEPSAAVVPAEPAPEPVAPPPPPPPPPCQAPGPGQRVSLSGCKTGDSIVLHGVNFEFDKAKLTLNAQAILDNVADELLAYKDIHVEIDGHTDGKGSVPYNQKLSDRRAASVLSYLAGRGIGPERMTSKGFGKSMPIADNATDAGRELNRRVELKVTQSSDVTVTTTVPGATPQTTSPADAPPDVAPPAVAPDAASPAAAPDVAAPASAAPQ